ncbi:MAG: hypothetical protein FWD68_05710 [Alphaproteobacteria bacterium]|nr:hypothetical protein [Alphaproteobacteria bacterium]
MPALSFMTTTPQEAALADLVTEARKQFSSSVFWCIPKSSDLLIEAWNIGHQLEKYGGMRGVAYAARIERALRECEQKSWR